jgi:hypothetical protein
MRRLAGTVGVIGLVVAATAAGWGVRVATEDDTQTAPRAAAAATGAPADAQVLEFVARPTRHNYSVDLNEGPVGGVTYAQYRLLAGGANIGVMAGKCENTAPTGPRAILCMAVVDLADGHVHLSSLPRPGIDPDLRYAVTGGTGRYRAVRGEMTMRYLSHDGDGSFRASLHLLGLRR